VSSGLAPCALPHAPRCPLGHQESSPARAFETCRAVPTGEARRDVLSVAPAQNERLSGLHRFWSAEQTRAEPAKETRALSCARGLPPRSSAVDPATLLAERAQAESTTRARPPDLGRHPISPPPGVERWTICRPENRREADRRGGAATTAPRNLPAGPPSCALFRLQNKPISTYSGLSWGREISSPGAAVIAPPAVDPDLSWSCGRAVRRGGSQGANDTSRGARVVGSPPTRLRNSQLPDWVSRRLPRC
jgi:hypothetical protein